MSFGDHYILIQCNVPNIMRVYFWRDINHIILHFASHHGCRGENLFRFFWQIHIPNDPLWLICEESNIVQPACFSLWDHEQLLAHNYVVIHCYLEEGTRTDS